MSHMSVFDGKCVVVYKNHLGRLKMQWVLDAQLRMAASNIRHTYGKNRSQHAEMMTLVEDATGHAPEGPVLLKREISDCTSSACNAAYPVRLDKAELRPFFDDVRGLSQVSTVSRIRVPIHLEFSIPACLVLSPWFSLHSKILGHSFTELCPSRWFRFIHLQERKLYGQFNDPSHHVCSGFDEQWAWFLN